MPANNLSREAVEATVTDLANALLVFADCYEADFPKSGYPHNMRKRANEAIEKVSG